MASPIGHGTPDIVPRLRDASAGHRYLHLYVDRFTDHARLVGVWHFITDQGHYHMIQQYGKAFMRLGDETISEIDAPSVD